MFLNHSPHAGNDDDDEDEGDPEDNDGTSSSPPLLEATHLCFRLDTGRCLLQK